MAKTKRRAVREPIWGKVDHYTHTKTIGIRNPITGKIEKRIKKRRKSNRFF